MKRRAPISLLRMVPAGVSSAVIAAAVAAGCTDQRDLYVNSAPTITIEGDWMPSLGISDMTGRATARIYKVVEPVSTDFFDSPRRITKGVSGGVYDVLIFNGLMFSDEVTNLEGIYFRNTDSPDTFEAVVQQAEPYPDLVHGDDEYLASRDMEILTSALGQVNVGSGGGYKMKYQNGKEQYVGAAGASTVLLTLTPRPLSWRAKVVVHLINAGSMSSAAGSLMGFAGSVFMAGGTPSHMRTTHQLPLGSLTLDEGQQQPDKLTGTIESPVFVTFGPPTDIADGDTGWPFRFDLSVELRDGSTFEGIYDISKQIAPVVEKLRAGEWYDPVLHPIIIEIMDVELPSVDSSVAIDPWEDNDEIIKIPVTNN